MTNTGLLQAWRLLTWAVIAALGVGLASCRDATQIVLRIRSDVPCAELEGWRVAVNVGKPGEALERQAPSSVATKCEPNGGFGTLVIAPSGDKDDEVGIVVVAGVDRDPEACRAASYEGCIVARRVLRFAPHDELNVDIELVPSCLSIACNAEQTCVLGKCVDSRGPEADSANADPGDGEPPKTSFVRCGDDGVHCPTQGNVCCLTVDVEAGTSRGDCRDPELCLPPSITLRCDDNTDCPRGGENGEKPSVCALSYTPSSDNLFVPVSILLSECRLATDKMVGGATGIGLCQDHQSCADAAFTCMEANSRLLPGFSWCQLAGLGQ